jgi:hypothetical protein
MLSKLRPHLTYANVVSTMCLFVLLGGTAVAASVITGKSVKDGSLTGKDVKNSSLTGKDVRAESIKGDDIENGSLLGQDFAPGQLPQGPQGPKGEIGPPGQDGNDGSPGSDAPADGPAVLMGRIADPSGSPPACLIGAPSGLSATAPCNTDHPPVEMPVPSDAVVLNLRARLAAPLDKNFVILLAGGNFGSEHLITSCGIPAGSTTCTADPSSVSAGEPVFIEMTEEDQGPVPITAGASFAYELWSPSAVPAAVLTQAQTNAAKGVRSPAARWRVAAP